MSFFSIQVFSDNAGLSKVSALRKEHARLQSSSSLSKAPNTEQGLLKGSYSS